MRKLLIVIDMQNDYIDAALGTKEAVYDPDEKLLGLLMCQLKLE